MIRYLQKMFLGGILILAHVAFINVAANAAPTTAQMKIDSIVAIVNDAVITYTELEDQTRTIRQQLRQQNTPAPDSAVLQKQVLERLITSRLQLQLAASTGIRVDDDTLNRAINRIAEQNKLSLSEFRSLLEKDGFSFDKFREDIRGEITITRLRQRQVDSRIIVTDQEVAQYLATQARQGKSDDEYRLGHILIALPEAAAPEKIQAARQKAEQILEKLQAKVGARADTSTETSTETGADFKETAIAMSDGQQALEGGDLGWRSAGQLPSLFAPLVPAMKVGELSSIIRSPGGFHIIKLLDYRGGKRHTSTQALARHILIRTTELITDDDASIRLEQLVQRIKKGEDFAELARTYSDDKISAAKGGSLDWVSPGDMVPVFEQTMTELQPAQISAPFKSEFGWHIVQVQERREHDDTEEYTRTQAQEALRSRKIEEEYQNWLRRLRDEAYVEYRLDDASS